MWLVCVCAHAGVRMNVRLGVSGGSSGECGFGFSCQSCVLFVSVICGWRCNKEVLDHCEIRD